MDRPGRVNYFGLTLMVGGWVDCMDPETGKKSKTYYWCSLLILEFYWFSFGCCCKATGMVDCARTFFTVFLDDLEGAGKLCLPPKEEYT